MGSDVAIYDQIAAEIGAQIRDGSLQTGEKLPAARRLAESLDINVHTVLKGYARLEREGLVLVRRGRGGVVVKAEEGLAESVRRLVEQAKSDGISQKRVMEKIEEIW